MHSGIKYRRAIWTSPYRPVLNLCQRSVSLHPDSSRELAKLDRGRWARHPTTLTFVQDYLIAEYDNIKVPVGDEPVQNVPAWLAPGLDIEGANTDSSEWSGFS